MFSAVLAGPRLLRRYGPSAVVAGSIATAVALATVGILVYGGHARHALSWIILAAAIGSLGNGIVLPALIGTSLVEVKPRQAGAGAGVLTTAQQFASSAGMAIVGTIVVREVETIRNFRRVGPRPGVVLVLTVHVPVIVLVSPSVRPEALSNRGRG